MNICVQFLAIRHITLAVTLVVPVRLNLFDKEHLAIGRVKVLYTGMSKNALSILAPMVLHCIVGVRCPRKIEHKLSVVATTI